MKKFQGELSAWGPISGKYFYMSEFLPATFKHFPRQFPGHAWPKTLALYKEGRMLWLNERAELQKAGGKIFLEVMVPQGKKLRVAWRRAVKKLNFSQDKIDPAEVLSDAELIELGKEFYAGMLDFWVPTFPAELGNYGSEAILAGALQKLVPAKDRARIMEILTAPEELSFYQQEELDLAKAENIESHQQKYFWLKNSYARTQVLPADFFRERRSKSTTEPQIRLPEITKKKKEVEEKYNLPAEVMRLAGSIAYGMGWQDERKKHIFIMLHYKSLFVQEVARRRDISFDMLLNCSFAETIRLLEGKNAPLRASDFGFYAEKFHIEELDADRVPTLWDKYDADKVKDAASFKGIITCSSEKIRGRVQILLDPYQEFTGDILVAPMTSPEYIFAMKKAKAIITDTGGLTSHAAIVSRELGIPCLVGTKVATKVLKDGDMVEVDTVKGVVRKLS